MKKSSFKIGEKNKYLTLKVILGYALFGIIAFGSIFYILNVIEEMTMEDPSEQEDRGKTYLITRTISLLNESAALGQPIGMQAEQYNSFNETMDQTLSYLDELRLLLDDSVHIQGIDTIEVLIEKRRLNTLQLYTIWKDMNTDRLYKDIKRTVADTVVTHVEIKEQMETTKDSLLLQREKKGFFRRLGEAFVPPKDDVEIVVNTTSNIHTDSLVNVYTHQVDSLSSIVKRLQDQINKERKDLNYQLYNKAAELRHNNTLINTRINQILYEIEEQEMAASIDRMAQKQKLHSETSRILGFVAIVLILIILIFTLLISRDISKSKYYRIQLEKAKQYADELLVKQEKFMLTISHDIRAPLSSILGYLELLLRRNPDDRQRYYMENMVGSSNHILSLVNNLLDFHRLDSGKMEIQRVAFNVKSLFDDVFVSFKPMADAKKLALRLEMDEDGLDLTYSGDPIRIRQVASNLLSNAIKFTSEGEVVLSVNMEGKTLQVTVRDTGVGISEEEQDSVFGEFTRLKREKNAEGFGLGLFITRRLVVLMGGGITLESTSGEGSIFYVELPLEVVDKNLVNTEGASLLAEAELKLADQDIKCLLVDDDPLQLALTGELLKQASLQVESCTEPNKVLELLACNKYDIIITDIQMPGLDGFELVKQIRDSGIEGTDSLPVIALSASVANEKEVYLDAGFTGFLNKPFTAAELVSVFNNLFSTDLHMEAALNFSSLVDFAGDDKEALTSILQTFELETSKNMNLLREALDQKDRIKASKVAHKMIPVFSMIGANHFVQRLRLVEKNDKEMSDESWQLLIVELESQIKVVMADVSMQTCGL